MKNDTTTGRPLGSVGNSILWWGGHGVLIVAAGALLQGSVRDFQRMTLRVLEKPNDEHFSITVVFVVLEALLALMCFVGGHLIIRNMLDEA